MNSYKILLVETNRLRMQITKLSIVIHMWPSGLTVSI